MTPDALDAKARTLLGYLQTLTQRLSRLSPDCSAMECTLSAQEAKALEFLGRHGPLRMKDLAGRLRLAVSSTTALVDRMETKGFVERRRSDRDRRVIHVALTNAGKKEFTQATEAYLSFCRGMLMTLDEADQARLLDLFRKMSGVD
jgi:DNA-binding MarR family transcriptional regulator